MPEPIKINEKSPPDKPLDANVLCLGFGKSAAFFLSFMPLDTKGFIATHHPKASTSVKSSWYPGEEIPFDQGDDIVKIKEFIKDSLASGKKVVIPVTTDPKRGVEWLRFLIKDDEINKLIKDNHENICFILPQSPNPYHEEFCLTGCPVIQFDYYPGIGGIKYEEGSKDPIEVTAGVKGQTFYHVKMRWGLVTSDESIKEAGLDNIISHFTINQETKRINDRGEMSFLNTNAILHTVGMIVHIAQTMILGGLLDDSIFKVKTSKEFFEKLGAVLNDENNHDKIRKVLSDSSLVERGFYRQMPTFGPDVIMKEMAEKTVQIKKAYDESGVQGSFLHPDDREEFIVEQAGSIFPELSAANIQNHLPTKYAEVFKEKYGVGVAEYIEKNGFGAFINLNPPYLNPRIVVPTQNGRINFDHRFIYEEIPTIKYVRDKGKSVGQYSQATVFDNVISCLDKLRIIISKEAKLSAPQSSLHVTKSETSLKSTEHSKL